MNWPAFAKRLLLDDGRINQRETELIKRALLADHKVDREEAEFLIELKRSAIAVHPDFDRFLYDVLKRAVLRDGVIGDDEVRWLRKFLQTDGKVTVVEVQFLKDLKAHVKQPSPEFDKLYRDFVGA
jgi:hypothetical protein